MHHTISCSHPTSTYNTTKSLTFSPFFFFIFLLSPHRKRTHTQLVSSIFFFIRFWWSSRHSSTHNSRTSISSSPHPKFYATLRHSSTKQPKSFFFLSFCSLKPQPRTHFPSPPKLPTKALHQELRACVWAAHFLSSLNRWAEGTEKELEFVWSIEDWEPRGLNPWERKRAAHFLLLVRESESWGTKRTVETKIVCSPDWLLR